MNKWSGSRSNRREQMSQLEKLIEQRKREIEMKLKGSSEKLPEQSKIITQNSPNLKNSNSCQDQSDDSSDEEQPQVNKFKNDGSFFAQFMALQQQKQQDVKKEENAENETAAASSAKQVANELPESEMKIHIKSEPEEIEPENSLTQTNNEDDNESPVSPPEDKMVQLAIEKTAISVAMNGSEAEESMRKLMEDHEDYRWLSDKESSSYKYFQQRVEELKEAMTRAQAEGLGHSEQNDECKAPTETSPKKRKSRWSDEKIIIPTDPGLIQYAIQVYGNTELTSEQWKQLEDQRKMKMLFEMLQAKKRQNELLALAGKVKYEYDSDEEIEEGTWEHKRRKLEMEKTKSWAEELTDRATGKHHIGDFMPPEELEKFIEKWESLKEGKVPNVSDYDESKISSNNIGFKMLQKLGWSEGQGLGLQSTGITAPINNVAGGVNNAGLGQSRPDELAEGDDEYEAYRKRMMLAYRFRPNPLNNPRRSYY